MKRAMLAGAAAVAGAAFLVPMATADHRPGHNKGTQPNPNLSIGVEPSPIVWPKQVTISGKLRGADNGGKTVQIRANPFPTTGAFRPVGEATTDANGDYSFQHRPQEHTLYQAVAQVDPRQTSEAVTARVRMKVTRRVSDRTPADGSTITFSGKVGPAHEGMQVLIQRRRPSGSWKTMAGTPLGPADANNHSPYSTEIEINRSGVWRARVKKDDDHLGNKSRKVRIKVQ